MKRSGNFIYNGAGGNIQVIESKQKVWEWSLKSQKLELIIYIFKTDLMGSFCDTNQSLANVH